MTDQPQPKPTPVSVFYSSAHEDEALRKELEKHLSSLRRQKLISTLIIFSLLSPVLPPTELSNFRPQSKMIYRQGRTAKS